MDMLLTLFVVGLFATVSSQTVDPFCQAANCPASTTCRLVKSCVTPQNCRVEAQCLANPPQFSHTGVCITGDPILVMNNGALEDLTCGPSTPCPTNAYCNTDLLDTYATCCISNPASPIKKGACPANNYTNDDFCLDTCNNDGDCRNDDKCCSYGCNRECLPPKPVDPCKNKRCQSGYFCQKPQMPPSCFRPGQCYNVGDCVPCPPVCYMYCEHGNVKDPNGCPICECLPPPVTQRPRFPWTFGRRQQQTPQSWWSQSMPSWLWAFMFAS